MPAMASPRRTLKPPKGSAGQRRADVDVATLIPAAHSQPATEDSREGAALTAVSKSFYALPIRVNSAPTTVHLFISSKASWDGTKAGPEGDGRTLFVTGLPLDADAESLEAAFALALDSTGDVEVRWHRRDKGKESISVAARERQLAELQPIDGDSTVPPLLNHSSLLDAAGGRPTAHVRFPTSSHLRAFLALPPSKLPLRFNVAKQSFLLSARARHDALRLTPDEVKAHADAFMASFEADRVPPLSAPPLSSPKAVSFEAALGDGEEEEEWTVVTRGGHHGRSATMPSQHQDGAHDPYSQRSMTMRDAAAGAKVMKRGFADSVRKDMEADDEAVAGGRRKKRKGGELVKGFYKFERAEQKRNQKSELRRKFDEDRARIEQMRRARKFRPY